MDHFLAPGGTEPPDSYEDPSVPSRSVQALTIEEVRVLGCFVEKEATVPDAYPLTLNSLRQACNQTTARDPVLALDDAAVQQALDSLKAAGFVRFVHPAHGERSTKFRHVLDDRLELDRGELAVLAVLALRGPQTAAELRSHTERIHAFGDVDAVEAALTALAGRDEPLVVALARQPGQHQARWAHLLAGPIDVGAFALPATGAAQVPTASRPDRIAELSTELAELRARVDRLETELGMSTDLEGRGVEE